MNNRERLIEILSRKVHPRDGVDPAVVVADFLLDNDILPVVCCKECAHGYDSVSGRYCSRGPCVDCFVPDSFFCRYGERGKDEAR